MGVDFLALQLECACVGRQEASVLAKEGRFWVDFAPESQTLIVLSNDPDTIVLPSGEKATDRLLSLWALVFSLLRLMTVAIIL